MRVLRNASGFYLNPPDNNMFYLEKRDGVLTKIGAYDNLKKQSQATIEIKETDQQWTEAFKNWLAGKNPTDSKEWKLGVWMCWNHE